MNLLLCLLLLLSTNTLFSQVDVFIHGNWLSDPASSNFQPGFYFVPKTNEAHDDFMNNGIQQNSTRTRVIESVLNNATNLTEALTLLDVAEADLQAISAKSDIILFVFEKMPAWLSSSADPSSAGTPGYSVLNTKPPANYLDWNNMVDAIVSRIVNTYGITNAYFEIWNEPDLGSWTGTQTEYFELYHNTYDAIKAVGSAIPVGGPATNYWANNITWQPLQGYMHYETADSSLIAHVMDSINSWGATVDFVSWHNFSINTYDFIAAQNFILEKANNLGIAAPELIVSEWNVPSVIRDTPLAHSYFIKALTTLGKSEIDYHQVAAWQDFEDMPAEFHGDYGVLSYDAIHKPVYHAMLLMNELKGSETDVTQFYMDEIIAYREQDSIFMIANNYSPPPFYGALLYTMYEGEVTLGELDSAGYISIATNNLEHLDSIYQGFITIPSNDFIQEAINNSISTYNWYKNKKTGPLELVFTFDPYVGSEPYYYYLIDSTENNTINEYHLLSNNGYTHTEIVDSLRNHAHFNFEFDYLSNSGFTRFFEPNSIFFLKSEIVQVWGVDENQIENTVVYPNPTSGKITLDNAPIGDYIITNSIGQKLTGGINAENSLHLRLENYAKGIYYLKFTDHNKSYRIVKN